MLLDLLALDGPSADEPDRRGAGELYELRDGAPAVVTVLGIDREIREHRVEPAAL